MRSGRCHHQKKNKRRPAKKQSRAGGIIRFGKGIEINSVSAHGLLNEE